MDNNTAASASSGARPELKPKPTPSPKPIPTTLSGKLRAKLPSRGWMIFWGTIGSIGALVTRDHYLTVAAKKRVADKVDVLAKQPCGVQEMPRKVTVYIMPPPGDGIHKTRHYFKQFVKPVFDAAALDYEVKEGMTEGQIRSMVAADVRKKRQIAAGKRSELTEQEQSAPIVPLKSVSDGIVVLGRIALAEVLKGYNDGCLQSLDDPEPVAMSEMIKEDDTKSITPAQEATLLATEATGSTESTSTTTVTTDNIDTTSSTATSTEPAIETSKDEETLSPAATEAVAKAAAAAAADVAASSVTIPQDEAYFSVPPSGLEPIGYIPFKNLVGFRNFPKKLFALFNSYDCVEYAGGAVMKVAFAETKEMDKDDLDLGRDEEPLFQKYRGPVEIDILDRVREQVKLFVTPTHIPEPRMVAADEEEVTTMN